MEAIDGCAYFRGDMKFQLMVDTKVISGGYEGKKRGNHKQYIVHHLHPKCSKNVKINKKDKNWGNYYEIFESCLKLYVYYLFVHLFRDRFSPNFLGKKGSQKHRGTERVDRNLKTVSAKYKQKRVVNVFSVIKWWKNSIGGKNGEAIRNLQVPFWR